MATTDTKGGLFFIENALKFIEQEGGLGAMITNVGVGGVAFAFFFQLIEGIESLGGMFIAPFQALVGGFVGLLDAVFGGWIDMLDASTDIAVQRQAEGLWLWLGPLQPIAILLIVMLGLLILMEALDYIEWSPLTVIFDRFG